MVKRCDQNQLFQCFGCEQMGKLFVKHIHTDASCSQPSCDMLKLWWRISEQRETVRGPLTSSCHAHPCTLAEVWVSRTVYCFVFVFLWHTTVAGTWMWSLWDHKCECRDRATWRHITGTKHLLYHPGYRYIVTHRCYFCNIRTLCRAWNVLLRTDILLLQAAPHE